MVNFIYQLIYLALLTRKLDLEPPPPSYDVKVLDGPAIDHALPTKQVKTFDEYSDTVFLDMDKTHAT